MIGSEVDEEPQNLQKMHKLCKWHWTHFGYGSKHIKTTQTEHLTPSHALMFRKFMDVRPSSHSSNENYGILGLTPSRTDDSRMAHPFPTSLYLGSLGLDRTSFPSQTPGASWCISIGWKQTSLKASKSCTHEYQDGDICIYIYNYIIFWQVRDQH